MQKIQQRIYEGRGQMVMLEFDLAELHEVVSRVLNQPVKKNIDNFLSDFILQLAKENV